MKQAANMKQLVKSYSSTSAGDRMRCPILRFKRILTTHRGFDSPSESHTTITFFAFFAGGWKAWLLGAGLGTPANWYFD